MRRLILLLGFLTAACDTVSTGAPGTPPVAYEPSMTPAEAARSFGEVVTAVEPVAEAECRRLTPRQNCDFLIVVDPRRDSGPNAFQSEDRAGRPVITFTVGLIASVDNADELAFIMSHEAAHHIKGHLARQRENAEAGAIVFRGLATLTGGNASDVANAEKLGAAVGARTYSKEFELEADQLGTIIAYRAGYNPLRGAQFFARIPDPGDRFLGTHPPNAARLDMVRRTAAGLGL